MNVLIADDSAVSREHLSFFCRAQGLTPKLFERGQELWDWICIEGVDDCLILLDWVMPDIEGPELCRRIRKEYPSASSYILLVTARDSAEDLAEGLGAGADDYLTKPLSPVEVGARLSVGIRTLGILRNLHLANVQRLAAERFAGVGQLAAGAAHEINNPLGFINSNLEFLQKHLPQTLGLLQRAVDPLESIERLRAERTPEDIIESIEDYTDLVSEMRGGVDRIRDIIRALQSFSTQQPQKRCDIDVKALLTRVLPPGASVTVSSEMALCAEEPALVAMLEELVNNAVWATREGGDIELLAYDKGDGVCLEVRDTGCGIPAENLDRVSDPFFTTKPIGSALGLGLSKAKAIVRTHGGNLSVFSDAAHGTRVICEFPQVI